MSGICCNRISSTVCGSGRSTSSVEPTAEATDIYLRPDGSDSNSGLSSSQPKQTLQAALDLIPTYTAADVRLHVGDTPASRYSLDDAVWPRIRFANDNARFWVLGDGADGGVTDPYEEVTTGTVDSVVTADFAFNVAAAPGTDAWVGAAILFTSGSEAGKLRAVNYVSGTEVRLSSSAAFSAGDTFRVVKPKFRFQFTGTTASPGPNGRGVYRLPGPPSALGFTVATNFYGWVNVGFEYVGPDNYGMAIFEGAHHLCGVEAAQGVFTVAEGEMLFGAMGFGTAGTIDYSNLGPLAPPDGGFVGWGLLQDLGDPNDFTQGGLACQGNSKVTGYWTAIAIYVEDVAYLFVVGGRTQYLNINGGANARIGTTDRLYVRGIHDLASVVTQQQAILNVYSGAMVDNTGTGSCFLFRRGCRAILDSGNGDSGSSAAAYGIDVQSGANVLVNGAPQYTGALADTRVNSTTHANAFYSGPGIGEVDTVTGSRLARI